MAEPVQQTRSRTNWNVALRALRPGQWRHFLALPLAGQGTLLLTDTGSAFGAAAAGALVAAGCLAWAYGLNAITDREQDRSSAKNPLVGIAPGAELSGLLLFIAVLTIALAAHLGGWTLSAALVSLSAGSIYSAGPRLKALPGLGTGINALIFAPLPLMGAPFTAWSWPPLAALVAVFVALLCHNQLLHELADAGEDTAAAVHTTAARLGASAAAVLGALLAVAAALVACPGQSMAVAGVAIAGLVISSVWLFRARSGDPVTLRRSHRWLAMACGVSLEIAALFGSAG